MAPHNIHATGVVLSDRGVMITGPSGSGKSLLAISLIERFRSAGRFACMIADDQLLLSVAGSRLVARCPLPIAGLVEIRGLGPVPILHRDRAVIDLLVRLVPADEVERLPEPSVESLLGINVPCVAAPFRDVSSSMPIVFGRLNLPL
ncbi:HPr kinase/phosphorylase [Corticibacterium sp. UT-5YL-CI-8]|nr:HPr kinase/phosphorylase [Tianweitania sp. UT-5YL-CI-8]